MTPKPETDSKTRNRSGLRDAACSPVFSDTPETAEYIKQKYNVRMFDAMKCFEKMAQFERERDAARKEPGGDARITRNTTMTISPHYSDHLIAALRCLDDDALRSLATEILNRLPSNNCGECGGCRGYTAVDGWHDCEVCGFGRGSTNEERCGMMPQPPPVCLAITPPQEKVIEVLSLLSQLRKCTSPIASNRLMDMIDECLNPVETELEEVRNQCSKLRR